MTTDARIGGYDKSHCGDHLLRADDKSANLLTNPVLDPIFKIPEFKVCACRVRKDPDAEAAATGGVV